jgi:organic hydroperoxide reductase OsmC/OhrA
MAIGAPCRSAGTPSKNERSADMSEHRISIDWARNGGPFARGNYLSDHEIRYSGGQTLRGAPSPEFGGDAAHADPEQLLLSALSSCHMLTFLAVCANRGYVVDSYHDDAVAVLGKNDEGKMAVLQATLAPRVTFAADHRPTAEEYARLHERAHAGCFIANSIRTRVDVKPA